jgi:two-component system phosphate regulon sensor histidine kinase PhoR
VPKIQLKLLGALAALVSLIVIGTGYAAERRLREREHARLEASVTQRARFVIDGLGDRRLDAPSPAFAELARRTAALTAARVTLIAPDGSVVADSDVAPGSLERVENHAERPEVKGALAGAVTTDVRTSHTVGRKLFYLAVPHEPGGVVRLAVDLRDVDAAIAELRRELALAGGVALLGALVLSFLVSGFLVRPLTRLRETVEAIAGGNLDARLRRHARDELGDISQALDRMREQLRLQLDELRHDKEQLQAVLHGMVEGVLVIGPDGRIALANPRLRALFGLRHEVEGRFPIEVIRNAEVQDLLRQALASREPVRREVEFGGTEPRAFSVHAVALAGGARGAVAVFHDMSEVRRLDAVRRDFVANASHELKTPLTAIRGFAETLLSAELPAKEARSYLEVIVGHSDRLAELLEDLLELSRIESRAVKLQLEELEVGPIAADVLRNLEPRFRERSLETRLVDQAPGTALADYRAVEQVLENLLDNAAKYTEPGGRVEVIVGEAGEFVRVDVADTGIGIPDADRARIFERFYRVDKARSRALGGTGLGLAIAKHLVQSMGGELSVQSTLGVGSTFTFTLPRVRT